jgi:uncharacterized protein YndB with AHSA1/START domain
MEVEISKTIDAPPEVVWHYLVDWERLGNWMKEASKFRVTSPHREGVGVEADAIIRIGWLSTIDPIRVARWEPPELLEIEHRGWVKGTGVMRCVRQRSGVQLWWTETLIPPWGLLGKLGMWLWQPLIRRTFERDLAVLKALVEGELLS